MTLGHLSGIVALIAAGIYIRAIFFEGVKPERASWFVWATLGVISIFGQLAAGGTDSVWLTVAQTLATAVIFLISIFKGIGGFTAFDIKCLAAAFLGVIIWQISNQPAVAIIGVIFADAMGAIPTLVKSYKHPETESWISYCFSSLAGLLGTLAVGSLEPIILAYPFYYFLITGGTVIAILLGHKQARREA